MADVELRTLGECQVVVRGERIGPQSPHAFALSLYLCIERGRPHGREALLALFFPDVEVDKGRHSLRQSIYKLRQLGVPCETTPAGTIVPAAAVQDDFTSLLATAELPDLPAGRLPGEFLPGYWPKISPEFTRWLEAQRDAVNSALRRAYLARTADRRAVARWDQVERYARACLAIDPLNEEATLALAEALALSGSKAAGVKVLDDYLAEVGSSGTPLTLPAATLRRRISERVVGHRTTRDLPMVGRDSEMRLLADGAAQARSGDQSTLWLHGEPGIGKSRLLSEFAMRLSLSGVSIVTVSSQSPNMPQSLSTISDAVGALLRLPGALGTSSDALSILGSVCSLPNRDATKDNWVGPMPTSSTQLAGSFCDLVDAVCSEQTLLLAFDDFHWADELSRVLVSSLCEGNPTRRLMLLLLSREAPRPGTVAASNVVRLSGLRRLDALEMLRAAFARTGHTIPERTIQHAADLASGNPFFLHALADHLMTNPETTDLPIRLVELIRKRVASVSPVAGLILRSCALLARHASLKRVNALLELPRHDFASGLKELEDAGLVVWETDYVSVSHALITEVVLGDRVSASSSLLDSAAAEMLEREARSAGSSALYWGAHACWVRSGDNVSAARCASEAELLSQLSAIVRFFDWAVPRNTHANDIASPANSPGSPAQESSVLPQRLLASAGPFLGTSSLEHSSTLQGTSRHEEVLPLIEYAQNCANSTAARLRAAVAALTLSETYGDADAATAAFEAAMSAGNNITGNAQADRERAILAYHTLFGDKSVALEMIAVIEGSLLVRTDVLAAIRSGVNAAEAACHCGDIARGLRICEKAYELAVAAGLDDHAADVAVHATWFARQIADTPSVESWSERAETMATTGTPIYTSHAYNQAVLAFDASDLDRFLRYEAIVATAVLGAKHFRLKALTDSLMLLRKVSAEETAPDAATVGRLQEWALKTAPFQPSDDVAMAVALALISCEADHMANDFLNEYLSRRRVDTYQCLPSLRMLAVSTKPPE